jgi:hypothetical protein
VANEAIVVEEAPLPPIVGHAIPPLWNDASPGAELAIGGVGVCADPSVL